VVVEGTGPAAVAAGDPGGIAALAGGSHAVGRIAAAPATMAATVPVVIAIARIENVLFIMVLATTNPMVATLGVHA
jgi:hypothetical protein